MSKDLPDNELDKLLKESFENHTIQPTPELWENISNRFQLKVVPIQQYSRLKIALIASVAVIAGLALILLLPKERNQVPETANQLEAEKIIQPQTAIVKQPEIFKNEKDLRKIKKSSVNRNKSAHQNEQTTQELNQYKTTERETVITPDQLNSISFSLAESYPEFETELAEMISKKPERIASKSSSSGKNRKSTSHKRTFFNSNPGHAKRPVNNTGHRRAKSYYAGNSRKGNMLENFTLKANVTPAVMFMNINGENAHNADNQSVEKDNAGFTINGGLELEYQVNNRWAVYSGLKISHLKQTFDDYSYTFPSLVEGKQELKTRAGNYLVSSATQLSGPVSINSVVKLQYLDIPLIGRYQTKNIYIDAGVNYSYLLNNRSALSGSSTANALVFEKSGGFKKHVLGVTAGVGMKHTSRSGWRFEVGPEIKYGINNLYAGSEVDGNALFIGLRSVFCISRYFAD